MEEWEFGFHRAKNPIMRKSMTVEVEARPSTTTDMEITTAFEIIKQGPASTYLNEGDTLTLLCKASSHWEYCTFKHSDKICDYGWTMDKRNVSVLACDDFADR